MLFEAIFAAVCITLLSLVGVFLFGRRGHVIGTNRFIIPLAIGVFLGVVFFELIPETIEAGGELGSLPIAVGFIGFYLLSQILHTYHHHHGDHDHGDGCEDKAGASMLLIGDTVHNLADGIVIASAFLINPAVGIATTIGVALHEIPQEIVEFGVLLKAGYSKTKATIFNFASASAVIAGVVLTLFFAERLEGYVWILTGLAAGNLLYIAASDLLPDVHAESRATGKIISSFVAMAIGLVGIMLLLHWSHENFGEAHEEQKIEENHTETTEVTNVIKEKAEAARDETEAARNANTEHDGPLEAI